jgi:hypothetical protein
MVGCGHNRHRCDSGATSDTSRPPTRVISGQFDRGVSVVYRSLGMCTMGVTPGVADPLLKVALPGNLDEGDGAPEEDNCKLGLMCSENGNEKTLRGLESFTLKVVCST